MPFSLTISRSLLSVAGSTAAVTPASLEGLAAQRGWVRARQGHGHDWSQFSFRADDGLYGAYEVMSTVTVGAVATNGQA